MATKAKIALLAAGVALGASACGSSGDAPAPKQMNAGNVAAADVTYK
jgi:hypothetical protein